MTEGKPSLRAVLKRLQLSGLVPLLPDWSAYAQKAALGPLDFLELALQDEIDRRERQNFSNRLGRAGFEEQQTFEDFDWDAPVSFDRDRVRDLLSLASCSSARTSSFSAPSASERPSSRALSATPRAAPATACSSCEATIS